MASMYFELVVSVTAFIPVMALRVVVSLRIRVSSSFLTVSILIKLVLTELVLTESVITIAAIFYLYLVFE